MKIIYVTAYEDFRDYAFSVHAFGYLVKPLDEKTFRRVFREALEYGEEDQEKILKFVTEDGLKEIGVRDILYLEYQNRRIRMVTRGGEFWIRERMFKMEERLTPEGFYMPHKSFIVNFYHVKNLRGYEICMSDGSRIPVSQKKSAAFREALSAWLADQI